MSRIDDMKHKVRRAAYLLDELEAHYRGQRPPAFPPTLWATGAHRDNRHVKVTTQPMRPDRQLYTGVLVGEVIHQLRTSLDHVVYALATRPECPPLPHGEVRHLEFLIRATAHDFSSDWRISQGFFERLIGHDELAVMERAQPYHHPAPTTHPLWRLRELDNIDKHRTFVAIEGEIRGAATAYAEDEAVFYTTRFAKATDSAAPREQTFALDWPHAVPIARVVVERSAKHLVFSDTGGLCDGEDIFDLSRAMIRAVDETLDTFQHFFLLGPPRPPT